MQEGPKKEEEKQSGGHKSLKLSDALSGYWGSGNTMQLKMLQVIAQKASLEEIIGFLRESPDDLYSGTYERLRMVLDRILDKTQEHSPAFLLAMAVLAYSAEAFDRAFNLAGAATYATRTRLKTSGCKQERLIIYTASRITLALEDTDQTPTLTHEDRIQIMIAKQDIEAYRIGLSLTKTIDEFFDLTISTAPKEFPASQGQSVAASGSVASPTLSSSSLPVSSIPASSSSASSLPPPLLSPHGPFGSNPEDYLPVKVSLNEGKQEPPSSSRHNRVKVLPFAHRDESLQRFFSQCEKDIAKVAEEHGIEQWEVNDALNVTISLGSAPEAEAMETTLNHYWPSGFKSVPPNSLSCSLRNLLLRLPDYAESAPFGKSRRDDLEHNINRYFELSSSPTLPLSEQQQASSHNASSASSSSPSSNRPSFSSSSSLASPAPTPPLSTPHPTQRPMSEEKKSGPSSHEYTTKVKVLDFAYQNTRLRTFFSMCEEELRKTAQKYHIAKLELNGDLNVILDLGIDPTDLEKRLQDWPVYRFFKRVSPQTKVCSLRSLLPYYATDPASLEAFENVLDQYIENAPLHITPPLDLDAIRKACRDGLRSIAADDPEESQNQKRNAYHNAAMDAFFRGVTGRGFMRAGDEAIGSPLTKSMADTLVARLEELGMPSADIRPPTVQPPPREYKVRVKIAKQLLEYLLKEGPKQFPVYDYETRGFGLSSPEITLSDGKATAPATGFSAPSAAPPPPSSQRTPQSSRPNSGQRGHGPHVSLPIIPLVSPASAPSSSLMGNSSNGKTPVATSQSGQGGRPSPPLPTHSGSNSSSPSSGSR